MIEARGNDDDSDILIAVENMRRATTELQAITALPQVIGGRVRWANGLIWERTGPNAWWPDNRPHTVEQVRAERYWPSSHIASGMQFEVLPFDRQLEKLHWRKLDPEPWITSEGERWSKSTDLSRQAYDDRFDPRPGYEQDRDQYA